MKKFMEEDFLLGTETARELYAEAEKLPIFDFHNHLSAREIYEDKTYRNLTELWLSGDHYKWRAMRAMGIPEEKITGNATDREKFQAWAKTVPNLIGNPLYHWTHLELRRYFDCDLILNPENAEVIWEQTKQVLQEGRLSVRKLLAMQQVRVLGTTDDPADDLIWHQKLREQNIGLRVCPTFRPDQALGIEKDGFTGYLDKLAEVTGKKITSAAGMLSALEDRLVFFREQGCMASDHSLEKWIWQKASEEEAEKIFQKKLSGDVLTDAEIGCYRGYIMEALGRLYTKHHIVMQLHIGAVRSQSERMRKKLGTDIGCDGMDDRSCAGELTAFLSCLDEDGSLPRTVLFELNPSMNEMLAVLAGSFGAEGVRCKVQLGPAWWFCDHKKGMEEQLECFASVSMLPGFIGMTTDSRSFLSFPRHEYFRRILCGRIGEWVENGEYPADRERLITMVKDICYGNAERFFTEWK